MKKKFDEGDVVKFYLQGNEEKQEGVVYSVHPQCLVGVLHNGKKYVFHTSALIKDMN